MLTEPMKKNHYLYKDSKTAHKILRIKKNKEYAGERLYILRGRYGKESRPVEFAELNKMGYVECITQKELNKRFRNGDFLPSEGFCL